MRLLQYNNLKNLSGEFIRSMQELVVLDLSYNYDFNKLPEQISKLTSLQYLDLTSTSIEQLPVGFQELKKLTHLDLRYTKKLRCVDGISKLTSLSILKLVKSKVHGDVSLLKELQLLEHLQLLIITISTQSGLEHILGDPRLANCIDSLHIYGFEQHPFSILSLMSMNLRRLWVEKSHVTEIDTNQKYRENPCFANLSSVILMRCNSNKDLTWLLFAPNLVTLTIVQSEEVEEIINKEKTTNLTGIIIPFQKLKFCGLDNLPKLESIYWSPLSFPCLRSVYANNCPKLRKLPLDATSVPRLGEFSITMRPPEQITDLEWEDEDTKNRFLPLFYK
uniref:Putative disease resistance protein n=1 Tax=Noccaea caerulescens TaxID=107243 RepID=A0A1J3DHU8_NOCCA